MTPLLEVNKVTKRFGGLQAVGGEEGLSFSIEPGAFAGLIGPNGAGKSTIFNLISGALKPTAGEIRFAGEKITSAPPETIANHGIGRTFQTPRAFESLSIIENVILGADNRGEYLRCAFGRKWRHQETAAKDAALQALEQVGLAQRAKDEVSDLSGGELRMLEVARQLVRKPKMLLLDEPTAGVDPTLQGKLAEILLDLHGNGMTLVVVEHNLHFLLGLANTVLVLNQGELLVEGPPDKIRSDPAVISAYLGGEYAA